MCTRMDKIFKTRSIFFCKINLAFYSMFTTMYTRIIIVTIIVWKCKASMLQMIQTIHSMLTLNHKYKIKLCLNSTPIETSECVVEAPNHKCIV